MSDDRQRGEAVRKWRDEVLRRMLQTSPQPLRPSSAARVREDGEDLESPALRRSIGERTDQDRD
jgi:hypothetical protein